MHINVEAFVTEESSRTALENAIKHRVLARSRLTVFEAGLDDAINRYQAYPSPDLLVLESHDTPKEMLRKVDALAEMCDPNTRVLMIGLENSVPLYRQLMARGIAHYLIVPVAASEVIEAAISLFEDPDEAPKAQSIAFMGVRGGIGASTMAHNTGWTLGHKYKKNAIVMDLDLRFGTAGINFNLEPKYGMRNALVQGDRLDEYVMEQFLIEHGEHLRLLASPPSLDDAVAIPPAMLDRIVNVASSMAGFVVIDIPHLWDVWVAETLTLASEAVLIVEPDLPSLRNAQMIFNVIGPRRSKEAPLRYIINNQGLDKAAALTEKDFTEALSQPPLLAFDFEPAIFRAASMNGQMLGEFKPSSKPAKKFEVLAETVSGIKAKKQPAKPPKKAGNNLFAGLVAARKETVEAP